MGRPKGSKNKPKVKQVDYELFREAFEPKEPIEPIPIVDITILDKKKQDINMSVRYFEENPEAKKDIPNYKYSTKLMKRLLNRVSKAKPFFITMDKDMYFIDRGGWVSKMEDGRGISTSTQVKKFLEGLPQ